MRSTNFPGLSVSIRVDGADLQEYQGDDDTSEHRKVTTRYIEVSSGSTFSVHITRDDKFKYAKDCLKARIYMDGKHVKSKTVEKSDRAINTKGVRNYRKGEWVLEKFKFADLRTTDASAKHTRPEELRDLGSIKVSFTRCVFKDRQPARRIDNGSALVDGEDVPEKGLKGRSISTKAVLAPAERCDTNITSSNVSYPFGQEPFTSFVFKYRSRRDLQIEGLIPRSPSPVPLEDRDPNDLTLEEARELLRRQNEQAKVKQEVKKEKRDHATMIEDDATDDDDDVEVSFSSERSKRSRGPNDSAVEIVDLSGD